MNIKSLLIMGMVAFMAVFTACDNDDDATVDNEPDGTSTDSTITQLVTADTDLSSLLAALEATSLDDIFNGTSNYTLFAPSNAAFATFLSENDFASVADIPQATLESVLRNHAVSGTVKSTDLTTGYQGFLAEDAEDQANIMNYIDLSGSPTINGSVGVTGTDQEAKNGVIHRVDKVITIPTVVTHATSNSNFSSLVAALTREDLDVDFVNILSGDGPFTVFAPTNAAFDSLLVELDVASLSDIPKETLEHVLQYHVVSGANVRSNELSDGQEVAALSMDTFVVNTGSGVTLTDGRGRVATVTAADVQAGNGVVHVIDKVILPPTDEAMLQDIPTTATNGGFNSLAAALNRANLVTTLQGDGPFTVFAPSDAAFTTFLQQNGFASLDDVPVATLEAILLNHVISGTVASTDLTTGYVDFLVTEAEDMANVQNYIDAANTEINGMVPISQADIMASNGIIHAVDSVIALPTVVTHGLSNPSFSTLVAALTRTGLTTDFVSVLSGDGPFTVFAPTNDAFTALLTELGVSSLDDIDNATLEAVLQYHVISGANVRASEITNGQSVTTLETGTFTIATDGDNPVITDERNRTSNVTMTDVQANNGVIHVIDTVILPAAN